MCSRLGKKDFAETAVSIFLLMLVILTAVSVFFKQFYYDRSRLSAAIDISEAAGMQKNAIDFNLLFPDDFSAMTEPEEFTAETLYVKINGKADLYLQSDFSKLSSVRFQDSQDQSLWGELFLYDMTSARNAFAVFSRQRRAGAENLDVTGFSYKADNVIVFAAGKYYVEIIAASESEKLYDAINIIAERLVKTLPAAVTSIDEFNIFPEQNLVADSFKLNQKDAFGCAGFDKVFTAKYKFGSETITAFVCKSDPAKAKELAEKYSRFLIDNGASLKDTAVTELKGSVLDFYDLTEIIFSQGPYVAGVHEADDQSLAEQAALMLKNKIKEVISGEQP